MKKSFLPILALPALIAFLAWFPWDNKPSNFHSEEELAFYRTKLSFNPHGSGEFIPIDSSILFPNAKLCSGCHGKDPNGLASITSNGTDVNVYDDWRSSMMANSAKDPFWRAKVRHEMLANPAHSVELQDKCTSCHAPTGHYQAKLKNHAEFYTLADLYADTLGLDGVTCQACHAQAPGPNGSLHSGALNFDTNYIRVAYGPYETVFAPPMHEFVGITPKYGEHISDAGLCAGCHTLITKSVDANGAYTGNTFVEQATYHEWLNSRYDKDEDNITCQSCHLPQIPDAVVISSNYAFLISKFPYGLHEMAGANTHMLKLMRDNRDQLGITALPEHFDSTIAATLRMLQEKSLDVTLETGVLNGDTARFSLALHNKAGHKFPSGYPARRAWVEFVVLSATGDTLFHSGETDAQYRLADEDANYEPHHQTINRPDQVQIYELTPGDVTGQFTNVLERAHYALKDNRLTPEGFRMDDPAYDTTLIAGHALTDPDFNRDAQGEEGSGTDVLHFAIPVNGYTGAWRVEARVWYQSLPLKWLDPMFAFQAPEIQAFETMFNASDRSPVLVGEKVLESVMVSPVSSKEAAWKADVRVYPTLSNDGRVFVSTPEGMPVRRVQVWDASGKMVLDQKGGQMPIFLPEKACVYFIAVETSRGRVVERVVRQ